MAKAIGTSQLTVSRLIKKLEKEGYIKEYTMILDFCNLGYELLRLSFVKFSIKLGLEKWKIQENRRARSYGPDKFGEILVVLRVVSCV